jgi:hypothetical protein
MWFQFAPGEDAVSIERQMFKSEYKNKQGEAFFRAPNHFAEKLAREAGCKLLGSPPDGAPENLPDFPILREQIDSTDARVLVLQSELSSERASTSALRAELAAVLHERDALLLQVHELSEELNEIKERHEDEGIEVQAKRK